MKNYEMIWHEIPSKAEANKGVPKASFVTSFSDLVLCCTDCPPSVTNLTALIWPCINSSVERPDAQTQMRDKQGREKEKERGGQEVDVKNVDVIEGTADVLQTYGPNFIIHIIPHKRP